VADTIGPDTPMHISRYFPTYKLTIPPTPPDTLHRIHDLLRERLNYVYVGNLGEEQDTKCAGCGALVITRRGYSAGTPGMNADGTCTQCGAPVAKMD
jgi:pyruvate formate lyase activating enzyme